ncbi:MAG: PEP-CTERM sorting domain-containing protein, partial [Armatimonadota bacterium]
TYGVTKAGRIYAVRTQLPRGTRVWATRSGEPVLKWLCANPLTKTLPGTRLAGKPRLSKPRPVGRGLAAPGPLATNGVIIPLEEVPPVPAAPPTPVATVTSSGTPGGTLVTTNSAPPTGARPGNGLWLPFGLAAGFALLQSPGSQSSVGGNEVPPTQPPTQPPLTPPPGGTPPGTTPTTPVVTPELPGGTVPGTPVGPVIPGPGTPGIPVNPEVPLLPNTPNTPGVPEIPGIPETLPVPEPSEWLAMGMAGTSVMGLMVRARRRRSAAA